MKKNSYIILIFWVASASAQLRLPTFFADNMVLQQQSENAVWGFADPGMKVTVSTSWGEKENTKSGADGKWKVFVKTPQHTTGQYIIISDDTHTITLNNIAIGEVWLCLGQSNMGWALKTCFNWDAEAQSTANSNLRIYKSDRQHWYQRKDDCPTGRWRISNVASAGETSAVAWYFGNTLQQYLDIPVGIIVQAYAGTPVEGWMPWEAQKDIERSRVHREMLDETSERQVQKMAITTEKALEQYHKDFIAYQQKMTDGDTLKSKNKRLMAPIITKPAILGNQYPAHIYNAMVHPLVGFGIKGIIWYQGERNSKTVQQALAFKGQLSRLINYYRDYWHQQSNGNVDREFYFSLTQLPAWGMEQTQSVEGIESPWAVSRNMMLEMTRELNHVGMAVSIDTGSPVELHPKNKKPIGMRHAFNVLHDVYGMNKVAHGPYFKSHQVDESKIILSFDGVGSGLTAAKEYPINSFAIAGDDRQWYWARAEIAGNTIVVSSDKVKYPVAVRYAWGMNPSQRNLLYNKEGLPASPFRTDNWELFEKGDEEIKVDKPQKQKNFVAEDWYRPAMNP